MNEYFFFAKRFLTSPTAIGSLFPSSPQLARSFFPKETQKNRAPIHYLEVGAGSGALTRPLVAQLRAEDKFDIVELDPKFCKSLRAQFAHLKNVTIHEASILDFQGENYDVLISSLPLNAFSANRVHAILEKYKALVRPGGTLSYYEYLGLGKIKKALLFGKKAEDFKSAQNFKSSFAAQYKIATQNIWWNFPPARVIHCKLP